jgi:glutathione peroxidase-family protein
MLVKPTSLAREYDANDIVCILNQAQACAFVRNGAELCDIYLSYDKRKFVYIFERGKVQRLMELWAKHELD